MLNTMHRSGSCRKNPSDDLPRDSRSPDKGQLYVKSYPLQAYDASSPWKYSARAPYYALLNVTRLSPCITSPDLFNTLPYMFT